MIRTFLLDLPRAGLLDRPRAGLLDLPRAGLLAILLGGCAAAAPTIVDRPVDVDVPVSMSCKINPVPVPDWAMDHVSPDDNVFVKGRALIAELHQRITYEGELLAAIASCQ